MRNCGACAVGDPGAAVNVMSVCRVGSEVQAFVGQGEVACDVVLEALGAGGVPADVMGGPQGAEALAAGGELPDELVELAARGLASGFGT